MRENVAKTTEILIIHQVQKIKSKLNIYSFIDRLITNMKFTWIKSTILILISMQITIINTCLYSRNFFIRQNFSPYMTVAPRQLKGRRQVVHF